MEEIATGKGSLEKFYQVQLKDLNELLTKAKKIEIKPSASHLSELRKSYDTARDINGKADFKRSFIMKLEEYMSGIEDKYSDRFEKLKTKNPLEWVGRVNNIRSQVREILTEEICS